MVEVISRTVHALDPLSVDEIRRAVQIIREQETDLDRILFSSVELAEPAKAAVLESEVSRSNGHLERLAKAVIIDRSERRSLEYIVSLDRGLVLDKQVIAAGQPPFTLPEIFDMEKVLRNHDGFREAMAKRGVTDLSLVWVDPWTSGAYDDETDYSALRFVRGLVWVREAEDDDNGYAHPVENLCVLFDLHTEEVLRIDDFEPVQIPAKRGNYTPDDVGEMRTNIKTLDITQPDGASFEVDGSLVRWQNWRLRVGFTPREGLVIRTVGWDDGERVRSILFRGAVSEMVVPYGDPALIHARKNVFDVGELNFGALANSLTLGCDCLGEIYYFDAALVDAEGEPFTLKNAICMHEEDYGVLWRHYNMRTQKTEVRRSRRLVISSFSTIGNYDYGFFWYFYQDGSIECEVKLTGILSTGSVPPGTTPTHGQLLNESGLYGPIHQHFFNFRLDLDIDGLANSVIEEHTEADEQGPNNPVGSAFHSVKTVLRTELEAQQLIDPLRARTWKVINRERKNAVGEPVGYRLVPQGNVGSFAPATSSIGKRAAFMTKHLWVTPFDDDEIHAAGDYPNQHPGGAGLPEWTAQDRSIEDTDVVLWYSLGTHHQPRPEDWPVMPVAYTRFMLMPSGFFDQNPALDVPPSTPHSNGHSCH